MANDALKLTLSEAANFVDHVLKTGIGYGKNAATIYLRSSPGMGKSSIIEDAAAANGYDCATIILAAATPDAVNGLPMQVTLADGTETTVTSRPGYLGQDPYVRDVRHEITVNGEVVKNPQFGEYLLDERGNKIENPQRRPRILFYDELSNANASVQTTILSIITSRQVDGHLLGPKDVVIAAGNSPDDGTAMSRPLGTSMVNRLTLFDIRTDTDSWVEWGSVSNRIHPAITGFIHNNQAMLYDSKKFTEAVNNGDTPFGSPRSWEMASRWITSFESKNAIVKDTRFMRAALNGLLGSEITSEFIQFYQSAFELPDPREVIAKGKDTKVTDKQRAKMNDIGLAHYMSVAIARAIGNFYYDNQNQLEALQADNKTEEAKKKREEFDSAYADALNHAARFIKEYITHEELYQVFVINLRAQEVEISLDAEEIFEMAKSLGHVRSEIRRLSAGA